VLDKQNAKTDDDLSKIRTGDEVHPNRLHG
jgi:hypothetical protein